MSVLQYAEDAVTMNAEQMQIWDNAAFDNGESEDSMAAKASWWSQSIDSNSSSKENMNPAFDKSPVSLKPPSLATPFKIKPILHPKTLAVVNPLKAKQGILSSKISIPEEGGEVVEEGKDRDEKKIDLEIESIEKEIRRLSTRLDALRLEKAERQLKTVERKGRVVAAKFMERRQSVKFEEPPPFPSSVKPTIGRRGVSLGPAEIATKARLLSKQEMTPVSSTANRRKSCFWKLDEIDELKMTKERGKSQSVSPRSRKTATKPQPPKQAQSTVGSKRPVKKEDGVLTLIQPKTLFKEGEKSVPNKKPSKPGRIVASRYNQIATNQSTGSLTEARKRSLPESDKEDGNKRRASRGNGLNQKTESIKVKKKWEIPREVVMFKGEDDSVDNDSEESPSSISALISADDGWLPKIRTARPRSTAETPRDSGAAKRVADLVGTKSYFAMDEVHEEGGSVCVALRFEE
ncbi:unnamed protein product [Linum trigynum]|uniref:Uncharacterized protein n=1 Tax=Linum trigynum TaxID=586398 RepID=A0AAV2F6Z8_9ROSI